MSTAAQPSQRLSIGNIFSFAAGALPLAALGTSMQIFVQPYMAKNLGLSLVTIGAAFFIVRMLDLFVDPLLAMLMDRTRTPFGRYRVWMFAGLPIVALSVYQLFFAKPGIDETFLVIWLMHGLLFRWRPPRISDRAVERALEWLVLPLHGAVRRRLRTPPAKPIDRSGPEAGRPANSAGAANAAEEGG